MRIINKRKFLVSNLIIISIIIISLLFISKYSFSNEKISYSKTYIQVGDTLWNIAEEQQSKNKYYKDKEIREIIRDIKKVNNLKSSDLSVGQELKIPIT